MTFNSSQQERLLTALERIADALEAAAKPVQPTAIIHSDRPITAAEAKRLHDVYIEARDRMHARNPEWGTGANDMTDPQTTKGPYR